MNDISGDLHNLISVQPCHNKRSSSTVTLARPPTGSFKVEIRANTAKLSNMIIARFRESRYLVRESKVFIKDKTKQCVEIVFTDRMN